MPPFFADPFRPSSATPVDPALTSFADEVCAAVARLFAYVGTLALIGILAVHGCDQLLIMLAGDPRPAFSIKQADSTDKTVAYPTFAYPSEDWMTAPGSPRLRGAL